MAEQGAWKVFKDRIELLQSLGYLPKMPTGVVAEVHQHIEIEAVEGFDELKARMDRLKALPGGAPEGLDRLMDEVQRGRVAARIERATQQREEEAE
jgi:hypothetical protein